MKLCLNMIVKNESARIERCLSSLTPWIDCWAIVDTGSTDGTHAKIMDMLGDLPGKLSHFPFVNFGVTRNDALTAAYNLYGATNYDYILLVDADMELVVTDVPWRDMLTAPAYKMLQKNGGLSYWNTRLLR